MDFDRVILNRNHDLAKVLGPKDNFKSMVIGSLGILSVANLISKIYWCQDFQGNPVSDYHKARQCFDHQAPLVTGFDWRIVSEGDSCLIAVVSALCIASTLVPILSDTLITRGIQLPRQAGTTRQLDQRSGGPNIVSWPLVFYLLLDTRYSTIV